MANQSLNTYNTRSTPQSEPIPGRTSQVKNNAGGHVFKIDKWSRLNRWLIIGSEGGSFYVNERGLTLDNLNALQTCIHEDGPRTVSIIVNISQEGRAPKNDQALFALAMCSAAENDKTRIAAFEALPQVARIGTHLFQFITYMEQFRGWGKGMRRAVGKWYVDMDPDKLALQAVKYRSRAVEGKMPWNHRDVLRKVHISAHGHAQTDNPAIRAVLAWIAGRQRQVVYESHEFVALPSVIEGYEKAQRAKNANEVVDLISTYKLPRECIPTKLLNTPEVYAALLPHMPIGALVRNLATMTRNGLLTNMSDATSIVIKKLSDMEAINKGRIHPIAILAALKTYESGRSVRGSSVWSPVPCIVDALDRTFYMAFDNIPATGKRRLIALDVSSSMFMSRVQGIPGLDAATAAAAMAMVSVRSGDPYEVVAFTNERTKEWGYGSPPKLRDGLASMSLSPRQRLDDIVKVIKNEYAPYMARTDCSLPMVWAMEAKRDFDLIEIYTDNETWAGKIHTNQALTQYRQAQGRDTKLIVVGMTSSGFSIADPNDPGMLDVCGFDTATPQIMSYFAAGDL